MDRLYENFNKLLKATSTDFIRYKYTEINWDSHMLGLVGPRGVGKTTMFLQHIKQNMNPKTHCMFQQTICTLPIIP